MTNYFILSGLALCDNNRGTAALGYGAFSFLKERGYIDGNSRMLKLMSSGRPFKVRTEAQKSGKSILKEIKVANDVYIEETVVIPWWQMAIHRIFGILLPCTKLSRTLKDLAFVAAINGGDGFSDIYNTATFMMRLPETLWAMKRNVPVILLPQKLGPFSEKANLDLAEKILRYASAVFVRDNTYNSELDRLGIKYEETNDLSYYMQPEKWDIQIDKENSIGINVSGLAYSNAFRSLAGQFAVYPELIDRLIVAFQKIGKTIYLIPHSYHFAKPEKNNDDIEACRAAYEKLVNKENVVLIDKWDLTSPQTKYLISQMSFFCGTRMHANYAAIFTKVPVFGFAYSKKFIGAFERNGIANRVVMINNIKDVEIDNIVNQVLNAYYEDVMTKGLSN